MQDSQANCGPVSVANALKSLGINRAVEELETLLGTSATEGTSTLKMLRGLVKIDGLLVRLITESRSEIAHLRLDAALRSGRPCVVCVDSGSHYVCAIGRLGTGRIIVADSADTELVLSYTWEDFMQRWHEDGTKKPYWGVVL